MCPVAVHRRCLDSGETPRTETECPAGRSLPCRWRAVWAPVPRAAERPAAVEQPARLRRVRVLAQAPRLDLALPTSSGREAPAPTTAFVLAFALLSRSH